MTELIRLRKVQVGALRWRWIEAWSMTMLETVGSGDTRISQPPFDHAISHAAQSGRYEMYFYMA